MGDAVGDGRADDDAVGVVVGVPVLVGFGVLVGLTVVVLVACGGCAVTVTVGPGTVAVTVAVTVTVRVAVFCEGRLAVAGPSLPAAPGELER